MDVLKLMHKLKTSVFTVGLAALMTLAQGCSLLSSDDELTMAEGPVEYVNNTLQVNDSLSLNVVWAAANAALQQLQIPVSLNKKDRLSARLEGLDAQHNQVIVQLARRSRYLTNIQITVGKIDCTASRSEAEQIHEKMKDRY
jgi:acyl-CoA synthetase (NDP forming)